jgi:hypothetical protein
LGIESEDPIILYYSGKQPDLKLTLGFSEGIFSNEGTKLTEHKRIILLRSTLHMLKKARSELIPNEHCM